MKIFAALAILSLSLLAGEFAVERPVYKGKIKLAIVRAYPDSFETYRFTNHNGREMTLVCARNRAYDDNAKAFLEYRNFYNSKIRFTLPSDQACKELGRFIERVHPAIDEDRPLLMELDKESVSIAKIVYPNIDPYTDRGELEDLLPKKKVRVFPAVNTDGKKEGAKEIDKGLF